MLSGIITLFLLLLFVAIAIWAWLPRNKKSFEATARLAVEDDKQHQDDNNAGNGDAPGAGRKDDKGNQA